MYLWQRWTVEWAKAQAPQPQCVHFEYDNACSDQGRANATCLDLQHVASNSNPIVHYIYPNLDALMNIKTQLFSWYADVRVIEQRMLQYSYHTYISTCINVSRTHTHDMGIHPIPVYIRIPVSLPLPALPIHAVPNLFNGAGRSATRRSAAISSAICSTVSLLLSCSSSTFLTNNSLLNVPCESMPPTPAFCC